MAWSRIIVEDPWKLHLDGVGINSQQSAGLRSQHKQHTNKSMDTITSSALEEICCSGPSGLSLLNLWPKLRNSVTSSGLEPSSTGVKQAIWSNLLNIDALQFKPAFSDLNSIQLVEVAEQLNLTIVADDHLRDCFFGVYDPSEGIKSFSSPQRRSLELLAIARSNGITQHDLAKELGMKGKDIFYVVRKLECQGLIVRQSTVVWKKGTSSEGEVENSSAVTTNMLYLYRYARHLGSQQRLEITKEDGSMETLGSINALAAIEDIGGEPSKEDVIVKDFLPGIKAICDKLEAASGKVLPVSDIKQCLGYKNKSGHRAWRNICNRLKDANVVEEFKRNVNGKVVSCLHLLKKFSPKSFEGKTLGYGNDDVDPQQASNAGKRGHITDQVVELPIEHQIYDMIDAEGSKGMTIIEVTKRLGISNKKYYNRLISMVSRFGMHLRLEAYNRGTVHRVWASGKFNSDQSGTLPCKSEDVKNRNVAIHTQPDDPTSHEDSILMAPDFCPLASKGDVSSYGKQKSKEIEPEASNGFTGVGERKDMLICTTTSQDMVHDSSGAAPNATLDLVNPSSPLKPKLDTRYPRLAITEDTIQRELRILKKLQEEKFVIRADLQRWLESYEKDKCTTMATKTLIHSLNKLQQQGQCKCIKVSAPVMTNCGRIRTKDVVLHPSVKNLTPGLLSQIHDKLRSHEMECRGHGLSRLKNDLSVPVLNEVQISHKSVVSEAQSVKSEAMRTNGFVLAKMIRAKLLHSFLWNYVCSSPDWDDAFSSGKHGYDMNNPHSTCKLFALDTAIKAIPLELFLQVVGSTNKFDDLVEKCRSGLRLSDLPVQEYKSLMNTLATGRLSWIIDVLRRLKLIRLVSDGKSEDEEGKVLHATFKHAMELKPYIEEPRTIFSPSSGYSSHDLRPQIRHDFVLFKRETVDDYWRTLEYCYSSADAVAAYYAFPGSSVPEVFRMHSWASVRVMTAEQRSELLKLVVKEDPSQKLSFKDCEKIAKDLNLTLHQVLRVYYDRRRQRLNRFSGASTVKGNRSQTLKRKRRSEGNSLNASPRKFCRRKLASLSEGDNQFTGGQFRITTVSEEHDIGSQAYLEPDHLDNIEESVHSDDDEKSSLINKCSSSRIKNQKKFSWTEKADRQLVIQYVTHRVRLGANFHRTDWALLPDLPAPPVTCKRRIANLKRNIKLRNSIMKLCNMLGERYAKHLAKAENKDISDGAKDIQDSHYAERWDDFDDTLIKVALDDALQYKRMDKFQSCRKDGYAAEILSEDPHESQLGVSSTICEEYQEHCERQQNVHGPRSSSHNLPHKFIKHLCEVKSICKPHESLAVSNAVELLKLVFLNTSTAAEVPNFLAETLRRYSEHDLFAAFSYLREKKVMIGGSSGNSFALSHHFLDNITSSPFPTNTGKRVTEFAKWLHGTKAMLEEEEEEEERVNLTADLQCGDILYLFALVSIGQVSITPSLPDEGVGDAEDFRGVKRKADSVEACIDCDSKKLKSSFSQEGETISRREKGFPGLMVSLSRGVLAGNNLVDLIQDKQICRDTSSFHINENHKNIPDNLTEKLNIAFNGPTSEVVNDSLWEAMAGYAEHLMLPVSDQDQSTHISPELFRTVWAAIQKAGDQGLSMEQVSKVADVKGQMMSQLIVEVLVANGQAIKVNAYDSVHVVNALYRLKYFLTSVAGSNQELIPAALIKSQGINDHIMRACNSHVEISEKYDNIHRVTILNLAEEDSSLSEKESEAKSELEGCPHDGVVFLGLDHNSEPCEFSFGNTPSCRPILPWINGDGTINKDIYTGLVRRILGTVMQNPGILEVDIIRRIDVLNPQNCRKLLELMILDNHLIVRKMHQTTFSGAPAIMGSLLGRNFKAASSIFREHFFANSLSSSLL